MNESACEETHHLTFTRHFPENFLANIKFNKFKGVLKQVI